MINKYENNGDLSREFMNIETKNWRYPESRLWKRIYKNSTAVVWYKIIENENLSHKQKCKLLFDDRYRYGTTYHSDNHIAFKQISSALGIKKLLLSEFILSELKNEKWSDKFK